MGEKFLYLPRDRMSYEKAEKLREECGVFGFYSLDHSISHDMPRILLTGMLANQHRGEESAGFVTSNDVHLSPVLKRMGHVKGLYSQYAGADASTKTEMYGRIGIGHTRYSTTGSSSIDNAGPFKFWSDLGEIALSHNGQIINSDQHRRALIAKGYEFQSTTDSEVIGALIIHEKGDNWDTKISKALSKLEGSFSLAMCTKDTLYAARDPMGNRPLSLGRKEVNGTTSFAISSETAAFYGLNIQFLQDIRRGELTKINHDGIRSRQYSDTSKIPEAFCGLEIAYLMRADSRINEVQLDTIRRILGEELAYEHPAPNSVDNVTYVPESARPTAEGYAEGLSKKIGRMVFPRTSMIKGRYGSINGVVRGFMNPHDSERNIVATQNYFPFDWVDGKEIVVVDDSIIRGNTTRGVIDTIRYNVGQFREKGAKVIHGRIIFPAVTHFCPLGTDINKSDNLVARGRTSSQIADYLELDTLEYHTPEKYREIAKKVTGMDLCLGCITGDYPVKSFNADKHVFE